jgi:hypothetical protein
MQDENEAKPTAEQRALDLAKERESPQLKPTLFWGVSPETSGPFPTLARVRRSMSPD